MLNRQQFLKLGLGAIAGLSVGSQGLAQLPVPLLKRIKAATIGVPDLDAIATQYAALLNYSVVEEGWVEDKLALSWGAPYSAGRQYIILQPETGEDVFVRAVEVDVPDGFQATTTWGWNSIEFVVDDLERVNARFEDSSLEIIGSPALLGAFPTIGAMQVLGPANEVLHLTVETGNRETSILPPPGDDVGRLIITILVVPDVPTVNDWYAGMFGMAKNPVRNGSISVVNKAQGLPADTGHDATFLSMAERGNFLELWSLPESGTTDRPRTFGQLPPGVAMATFSVPSLDQLPLAYYGQPIEGRGVVYDGGRSAVFRGPVGELVELVEERR